jgi:hypothetical protein
MRHGEEKLTAHSGQLTAKDEDATQKQRQEQLTADS